MTGSSPGSVGTTPAASTSLWAASRHYKQKTNAQQHERKRPQQASIKPGTWQTMRGPLHPLRGAAPVMWRCTRYVAIHPLRGDTPEQKGCNAYGSGALPLRTSESLVSVGHGMVVEVGLNNRRRASGVLLRYRRCVWTGVQGTSHWRCTRYGPLHPLWAAAPVTWRCTRYEALHPNRRGVMPTDRVQRTQSQEQTRNLRDDRRRIRTLTRYCERGQPRPGAD